MMTKKAIRIESGVRYKGLKMVITKRRGMKIEEILVTKEEHAASTS